MKLRFYLFDNSVTTFEQALRPKNDLRGDEGDDQEEFSSPPEPKQIALKFDDNVEPEPVSNEVEEIRQEKPYRRLSLRNDELQRLGFDVEAWVLQKRDNPSWFKFIEDFVSDDDPSRNSEFPNNIYGMLILIRLKPEERIFGISFGYGYQLVRFDRLESGFGRTVVLNTVRTNGLRTLDVHNIDLVTRKKRISLNQRSSISDFRLDGEDVIITAAVGDPDEENGDISNGQIEGTDSLLVSLTENLREMEAFCRRLLELFQSMHYTERFPNLTKMLPITGAERERLNDKLFDALNEKVEENLSLLLPSLDYAYGVMRFILVIEGRSQRSTYLESYDIESLYQVISHLGYFEWRDLRVGIQETETSKPKHWFSFLRSVIFLLEEEGHSYLYSLGNWYEITADYQDRIDDRISDFSVFSLPPINYDQAEGDYNRIVATDQGYKLLDKDLIRIGRRDRIEAADLLTKQWEFISVKLAHKRMSSSTLSHLFAQGSVSAILLSQDENYREKLLEQIPEQWETPPFSTKKVSESDITFVYAISTDDEQPLYERLPLFSKITLVNHAEEIRKLGFEVKLCRIETIE